MTQGLQFTNKKKKKPPSRGDRLKNGQSFVQHTYTKRYHDSQSLLTWYKGDTVVTITTLVAFRNTQ